MFTSEFRIGTIPETKQFYEIIERIGTPKKIGKGRTVIRQGSFASHFIFVKTGVLQTCKVVNGRKYTLGFSFAGDIDCCPTALLAGSENNFSIEALSNCEILLCSLNNLRKACTVNEYHNIVNGTLVYYLAIIEKRLIDSISLTAEERYRQMLKLQPEKIGQIPLAQIASFLGISKERLSRIRKKLV